MRHVFAFCSSCTIMVICLGFMICAIVYIVNELKVSTIISKKASAPTFRDIVSSGEIYCFHDECIQCTKLQTLIPFIFLYVPCGLDMLLPLARIDAQSIARVTPILISFFLPWDSLATILSMTEYRRELGRILKFIFITESTETNTQTSKTDNQSFQWDRRA